MGNANPGILSWAGLFLDYGRCVETAATGNETYLPGHHTAYKRDILMQYEAELPAVMDSEILLHWDMRAKGYQLRLEPRARVYHLNISLWRAWLAERFHAGRRFAATRSRDWPFVTRLLYFGGSPLIPLVRFPRIVADLNGSTFPRKGWPALLPPIFAGLVAGAVGEMAGYLFGAGDSMLKTATMELFKIRYLTASDRSKVGARSLTAAGGRSFD